MSTIKNKFVLLGLLASIAVSTPLTGYGDIINDLDITKLIKKYKEIEPELIEYIDNEYNYTRSINN